MRWRGLALACAAWVATSPACTHVPEPPVGPSPYVRALQGLGWVGPTPYDGRRLTGRVVLVSFFSSWSYPALIGLPMVTALQKEYGERDFQVVLVGMDTQGARTLEPFAQEYALPCPVLVSNAPMRQGQSAFGLIPALPAAFLLDREGRVAGAWEGTASHAAMAQAVETLLLRH